MAAFAEVMDEIDVEAALRSHIRLLRDPSFLATWFRPEEQEQVRHIAGQLERLSEVLQIVRGPLFQWRFFQQWQ